MELRDYLRILRRRWPIILTCLVIVVAVAGALTAQATKEYKSTAQLFISTSTSTSSSDIYQGSLASTQRVASYADLVTGAELAERVIERLGLASTPDELAEKVTAEAVPETVLLNISVNDPDPDRAKALTTAYSAELSELVSELETPPGQTTPLLKATVVDSANLPSSPVSPQPVRNLGLAVVLGLLLGLGLAILREVLDTSVKTADDVAAAAHTAVMAGIAYDPDTRAHPLISTLSSHSPRVEAFRILRTNLQFVDIDSDSKAFVVTSSVPGEGKSTTAVNTAITMAQTGQNILLIDGDLRRPQVDTMLGLEGSVGVTTVLLGKIRADEAVQKHETGLHVLTSGTVPPNPAELLQSHAMAELLADLRTKYDTIVFDAPPLLPVTDAALLASQVDGALLVVRHGKTTREQLHSAHERLAGVGAHPLGVVFNMVPNRRGGNYGYGYGYGYAPKAAADPKPQRRR
jgi:capsular exopolysaccharide synthesis family protein